MAAIHVVTIAALVVTSSSAVAPAATEVWVARFGVLAASPYSVWGCTSLPSRSSFRGRTERLAAGKSATGVPLGLATDRLAIFGLAPKLDARQPFESGGTRAAPRAGRDPRLRRMRPRRERDVRFGIASRCPNHPARQNGRIAVDAAYRNDRQLSAREHHHRRPPRPPSR